MINIMYVTTYGPVRVYMRNPLVFLTFLSVLKRVFGGPPAGSRWASKTANTRIHWQTSVFLMTFICKFALHDVKLLRQNGQWGGERGRGDLMYIWIEICTPLGQGPGGLLTLRETRLGLSCAKGICIKQTGTMGEDSARGKRSEASFIIILGLWTEGLSRSVLRSSSKCWLL